MTDKKKIVYIDMDGVLVDFSKAIEDWFTNHPHLKDRYSEFPDHIQGLFRIAPPMKDAIEAVKKLHESGKYELFIATSAPWGNPQSLIHSKTSITPRCSCCDEQFILTTFV